MKTIAVTGRSYELRRLLELAKEENIVVRTVEGHEYVLSLIDDFELEIALQRRNKELMTFLDQRFREARQHKGIPLDEVKRQLGIPRKKRKRRAALANGRRKR